MVTGETLSAIAGWVAIGFVILILIAFAAWWIVGRIDGGPGLAGEVIPPVPWVRHDPLRAEGETEVETVFVDGVPDYASARFCDRGREVLRQRWPTPGNERTSARLLEVALREFNRKGGRKG